MSVWRPTTSPCGDRSASQNVTVTATGATDTIRYGAAIFTGNLTGLSKDRRMVQFFGNANVSGVNVGGVLNAKTLTSATPPSRWR